MNRQVPPLRTELEYKPIDRDHLGEILGGFSCQREVECRVQNCFEDREHIISANPSMGAEPLSEAEQMLRCHPDFIVPAICRWKHMRINKTWDRSEPVSDDFAIGYLLASPVNLTANNRKRLKELRKGIK